MKNELERRIVEAVDHSRERIAETLQQLIRFESIVMADPTKAGPGERECQKYLENRLLAAGFKTDLWEPDALLCPGENELKRETGLTKT
jgi:acetylornithine deacetylase